MKKTLLATAIAGALGVTAAAQAATVYDQDGTKVDIYGRIAMGIQGGGPDYRSTTANERLAGAGEHVGVDNGANFGDAFSRLGLRLQHMVSSDLTAFGHLEWRFRADEAGNRFGNSFDAFSETRQAYLGLRSNTWGTIQAGNFDSFYKNAVTAPFDVYIDQGLEFGGHPTHSRGDSIGYITPNLSGFQVHLQAKHYSERGASEAVYDEATGDLITEASQRDEEVVAQGGVVYETGGLRLAAGFVDDKAIVNDAGARVSGTGNDEVRYGATVAYQFTPEFSARLGYETRDDNDTYLGGYDTWGVGLSYAVNQWTFNADVYDISVDTEAEGWDDRTAWAAGAYYNISSNMDVFLELYQGDQPDVTISGLDVDTADGDDMYYLVGARYFF